MFPLFRSKKSEPFGNDPELENADVEENGGTGEEFDAGVEETEDPVDDGIFVSKTGRRRQSSVTKAITYAAIGLAVGGTAFATGYGINAAVQRSGNSPAAAGVEEQLQVVPAAEEAAVTVRPSHSFHNACDLFSPAIGTDYNASNSSRMCYFYN